jgi:hypothetical protein
MNSTPSARSTFRDGAHRRTLLQSIVSPVISTSLYFVVFGARDRLAHHRDRRRRLRRVHRAGLIMLMLLTQSTANASFGIYFPALRRHDLRAPVGARLVSRDGLGFVGAAATKSIILGLIVLLTAGLFVPLRIAHPVWMITFLLLTAITFSLFGFIIGGLGGRIREAAGYPVADHHSADLPRRHLLFDRCAAAALAENRAVQPDRLSGQRLPLELL